MHGGLCPGTQGGLDLAVPRPSPAFLLSPTDVRGSFPFRQRSRQRPPRGLAWRRAGSSPAAAQSSAPARPRRRQLSLLTPSKPGRLIPWGRGHVLKRHTPCFLEDLRRDWREPSSPFLFSR